MATREIAQGASPAASPRRCSPSRSRSLGELDALPEEIVADVFARAGAAAIVGLACSGRAGRELCAARPQLAAPLQVRRNLAAGQLPAGRLLHTGDRHMTQVSVLDGGGAIVNGRLVALDVPPPGRHPPAEPSSERFARHYDSYSADGGLGCGIGLPSGPHWLTVRETGPSGRELMRKSYEVGWGPLDKQRTRFTRDGRSLAVVVSDYDRFHFRLYRIRDGATESACDAPWPLGYSMSLSLGAKAPDRFFVIRGSAGQCRIVDSAAQAVLSGPAALAENLCTTAWAASGGGAATASYNPGDTRGRLTLTSWRIGPEGLLPASRCWLPVSEWPSLAMSADGLSIAVYPGSRDNELCVYRSCDLSAPPRCLAGPRNLSVDPHRPDDLRSLSLAFWPDDGGLLLSTFAGSTWHFNLAGSDREPAMLHRDRHHMLLPAEPLVGGRFLIATRGDAFFLHDLSRVPAPLPVPGPVTVPPEGRQNDAPRGIVRECVDQMLAWLVATLQRLLGWLAGSR